jgi:hypothetical protein
VEVEVGEAAVEEVGLAGEVGVVAADLEGDGAGVGAGVQTTGEGVGSAVGVFSVIGVSVPSPEAAVCGVGLGTSS